MDDYDYMDNYLKGTLSPEEMKRLDQKIQEDPAFAEDLAFYCSTLQEIKNQVEEEKKERFRNLYKQRKISSPVVPIRRVWPYIAAAAIIAGVVFGLFIFTKPADVHQLADQYIKQNFQTLGVQMGNSKNRMQEGLQLYNADSLSAALDQFETILRSDTSDFTAKKYAGIVCLRLKQYDKALDYFTQLANQQGYHSNPGLFYKAITLLKRNRANDKEKAEQLLKQVVTQELEGQNDAKQFLKNQ